MGLARSWPVLNHSVCVSSSVNFKCGVHSCPWEVTVSSFLACFKLTEVGDFHVPEVGGVNLHAALPYSCMCALVFIVTHSRSGTETKNIQREAEACSSVHVSGGIKKGARLDLLKSNVDLALGP